MFQKNTTLIVSVVAISGLIVAPGHVLSTLPGDRHEARLVTLSLNAEEGSSDRIVFMMVKGFRSLILQLELLVGGVIDGSLLFELWQATMQAEYLIDASSRLRTPNRFADNPHEDTHLASYPEWPAEGMEIRVLQLVAATSAS